MALFSLGAEARVDQKGGRIIKRRLAKAYRHPLLDKRLRHSRTLREAKVLSKLSGIIPVPEVIEVSESSITMTALPGRPLKDVLGKETAARYGREMGMLVGRLHARGIIHGDLTTSNFIAGKTLGMIDFGLSFFSAKAEDKAVDLHLLREALSAKHWAAASAAWRAFTSGYRREEPKAAEILAHLQKVEKRGRHKAKTKRIA